MKKLLAYIRGYFAGTFEQVIFKERFSEDDETLIANDLEEQIGYFEQGGEIVKTSGNKTVLETKSSMFRIPFEGTSSKIDSLLYRLRRKAREVPEVDNAAVSLAKGNMENAAFSELPLPTRVEHILLMYRESAPHSLYNNEYAKRIYEDVLNPLYFEGMKYKFPNPDLLLSMIEESLMAPNVYKDLRKIGCIVLMALALAGEELAKRAYPNLEFVFLPFLEELKCI